MSRTLSHSLRPRNFGQLFGQQKLVDALERQYASGRRPNSLLFAGETGSGKTTIAKIISASLQCRHQAFGYPCKICRGMADRKEFNIHEYPAAVLNGVEPIKSMAELSNYAPAAPSRKRVMVLNEAQRITKQAQSVLLEYTEDTPTSTVWIFTTTEPEALLKALRGRCVCYNLAPLKGADIGAFIKWAAKRGEIERPVGDFIEQIHRVGVTSCRLILMGLERYASGMDPEQSVLAAEIDVDTLRVCQNVVKGNWSPIRSELEKATAEDARAIRSSLLGYLKAIILNPKSTANKKAAAALILDLNRISYSDDTAVAAALAAVLFVNKGFDTK